MVRFIFVTLHLQICKNDHKPTRAEKKYTKYYIYGKRRI